MTSYSTPLLRWLLGADGHPGGAAATRRAAELARVGRGARVLDVGCGRGDSALLLGTELGARVTGVDVDMRAVLAARRTGVPAVRGDALELPVADASFDVVVCEWALSTFASPARAVAEMARALRPGGRLVVTDLVAELDLPRRHPQVAAALARVGRPLPAVGYADLIARARLAPVQQESRPAYLLDAIGRAERGLSALRVLAPARAARTIAHDGRAAVEEGSLGWTVLVGRKP